MTSYERVLRAFRKEKSDHVPIYCGSVSSRTASQVLGREAYVGGGIQQYREAKALWEGRGAHEEFLARSREDAYEFARRMDFDFVRPTYWRMPRRPSARLDEHTFRYDKEDGSWQILRFFPEGELYQTVEEYPVLDDPDQLEAEVEAMEAAAAAYRPGFADFAEYFDAMAYFKYEKAMPTGGLGLAVPNRSALWYEAVVLRPDLVERLLEVQLQNALKRIPVLGAMGARFLYGGGDCAGGHGLMYSHKVFRELLVPRFRRISDACHAWGLFHTFGSDGNFWDVAESLYIDTGIDGHYEADCTCGMDIRSLRRAYPNITVLGGIASATLHMGTREQITAQVREALDAAHEYGGAVVGCSNLVTPQTPLANFELMMELLHQYK